MGRNCGTSPLKIIQRDITPRFSSSFRPQVAFFTLCAAVHAAAFVRWHRQGYEAKQRDWPEHGWFTALSCTGAVMGALAYAHHSLRVLTLHPLYFCNILRRYAARIGQLNGNYTTRKIEFLEDRSAGQLQEMNELRARELRFLAAHFALIPFELGFVIVAELQVLHRLQRLALVNSLSEKKWSRVARLFFAAVMAGLLIGAVGNLVAAV
jgi:hypothetical protein